MDKYSNFSKDLLELYCKTGKKEIEDLFLRFAMVSNFVDWIKNNKDGVAGVKDPNVMQSLGWLSKNAFKGLTQKEILHSLFGDEEFKKIVPYIMSLSALSKTQEFAETLHPFSSIFSSMSLLDIDVDLPDVKDDLTLIKNAYTSSLSVGDEDTLVRPPIQKMTQKAKKEMLYQNLLRRFSADVANAAIKSDEMDLAEDVRSGALAMPFPIALRKYFGTIDINTIDFKIPKKMADVFIKYADIKYEGFLYDVTKLTFLSASGQVTQEQIYDLRKEMEREKSYLYMHGEQDDELASLNFRDKIPIQAELDPKYLVLVSSYFIILQKYLNMPSAFEGF